MSAEKPTPERIVVDFPKTEIADEKTRRVMTEARGWPISRLESSGCDVRAPREQRTPIHPAAVIVAIIHERRKQLVGERSEDGFQVGVASAHPADEVDGGPPLAVLRRRQS